MNKVNRISIVGWAVLALLPLSGFAAYPIEVEKQLNGAEIAYSTQGLGRDLAALTLQNLGQTPAICSAVFRNGPEAPRTRRTLLEPGQTRNLTAKFSRSVIRLRIKLTCELQ